MKSYSGDSEPECIVFYAGETRKAIKDYNNGCEEISWSVYVYVSC